MDLTGRTIANRYSFDIRLGEGTFARVYRVHDTRRNVDLAAKVLRQDIALEPTVLERFRREGDVLSRLQHPNIVRYYDLIEEEDTVFILMDYVPGETLQAKLYKAGRPFTVREVFDTLKPLTAALHFAHGEGVIHRDLKPGNILIHDSGNLLVTDFGIARLLNDSTFASTLGLAMGTPLYMAPEQITSGTITAATDVYALGVVLYQLLSGVVPFSGNHPSAQGSSMSERITYEHLHVPPTPLRAMQSGFPEAVDQVVIRCLAKDSSQRPATVREVYDDLAEALGAAPSDFTPLAKDTPIIPAPNHVRLPEVSQFIQNESRPLQAITMEAPAPQTLVAPPPIASPSVTPTGSQPVIPIQEATTPPRPRWHPPKPRGPRIAPFTILGVVLVMLSCLALAVYALSDSPQDEKTVEPNPTVNLDNPTVTPQPITDETPTTPTADSTIPTTTTNVLGGYIVYASSRYGNLDIFVTDVTANKLRQQLTIDDLNQTGPSWSPDGSQIAFYAYEDLAGNADIYLMDADGENVVNLTNSPDANDRYVSWSPDGKYLIFHSNRSGDLDGSRDYELYTLNVATQAVAQITLNNVDDLGPDWSPDGKLIAFHSYEAGKYRIFTINPDGTNRQQLSPDDIDNAYFPTWSPDGQTLAFHVNHTTHTQIFLMNADGSAVRPLMDDSVDDRFPDWSPDGSSVIFQREQPNEQNIEVYGLYYYTLETNTLTAIGTPLGDFLPDWGLVPNPFQ